MDLVDMTKDERLSMMRQRQAYFSAIAEEFNSFTDFIKEQDLWLAIMGIQLTEFENRLELYMQLNFTEYEQYYVIKTREGKLTVSDIILWNGYCYNSWLNISTGEQADEEDILIFY
ncbi:MAG: hypothetical protein NC453_26545 [Muribaculum sp.]|nr:hypothetical protein [Muribaculum sp.]